MTRRPDFQKHPKSLLTGQGLVLLAPAVDNTETWWNSLSDDEQQQASSSGFFTLASDYAKVCLKAAINFWQGIFVLTSSGHAWTWIGGVRLQLTSPKAAFTSCSHVC